MAEASGTVVTPGNHDGVHLGHRALVQTARERADARGLRAVAMFFDPHPSIVLAKEHAAPVLTTVARRQGLLRGAGADDAIAWPFDEEFASLEPETFVREVLIGQLGARGVVVGPDFRFGRGRRGDLSLLRELGAASELEVSVVPPVTLDGERVSSTSVRERLGAGEVGEAARLLGRVHDVDGTVVKGDQRGRTIGFPTANLRCDDVMLPADGVYAIVARFLDAPEPSRLAGVMNIGVRPTVAAGRSVEAHLFDFAEDVYGARMRVGFVQRIRSEKKLAGLDALKAQIARDVGTARAALSRADEETLRWL
jgi:riboflavin kinase/FMN adenylyltransferase